MVKSKGDTKRDPKEKINIFLAFGKASEISFNLVFLPVILLFFGLFVDKTLNTTPLFIIVGSIAGLFFAVCKAIKIKDQIYKEFPVTNSLLTSVVVMVVFLIIAVKAYFGSGKGRKKLPLWIRVVTEGVYNFLRQISGDKTEKLFPLLFTFFIFILLGNWIGLLPGVGTIGIWEYHHGEKVLVPFLRSPNASLSITIALALISVVTVQILSIKALGGKKYLGKFFNFKNPINGFVGILE
ncbi:MAG: ATP synthase subunit a, partial [Candidatus Woesebacteria bacterium GW2011_GWC1_38_13]